MLSNGGEGASGTGKTQLLQLSATSVGRGSFSAAPVRTRPRPQVPTRL